ncbi:gas vesicle protein [Halocatena pleomorpha]|uniref:Gas vesicle protein n=1 Tax=Halocatena pleomorpha TaxID=1785090 RepID=A0A3P3R920_9EURY|nr:gas vesicle protein [Halocatena pleomorpha]
MTSSNQSFTSDETNSEESVAETITKLESTLNSQNRVEARDERENNNGTHEPEDNDTDTEAENGERDENGEPHDSSPEDEGTEDTERSAETDTEESSMDEMGLIEIRDHVREVAPDLIGRDLDGIASIHRNDETWTVAVDVVERHSVPDTQDIIGRYEIHLDPNGEIREYDRTSRYRRGDTGLVNVD